jgi:hypothetical protein
MAHGEDAGHPTTNEKENDEKRTAKLLWSKITADLARLRAQNGRISRQYLDALTTLARNVQAYSSLSRCASKKNGAPELESINSILEDSYLCLQQAEESKTLDQQLKAGSPFSQSKQCTTRLSTTKVFRKFNKRSYDAVTPSVDIIYPKPKHAKIEPDKPSKRNLFTLLASMHTAVRQIKVLLTVITKRKETWVKSKKTVAHFDESLWKALALDLSLEELNERTKESERMAQIRPLLKHATEVLKGDMLHVVEKLNGVNKDMRHAVMELKGLTKDMLHVVEEVKDLSNDIHLVISELIKMNQCMQFVPIRKELKKMTRDRRLVSTELTLIEKEMTAAVDLGTTKSRNTEAGRLGVVTKPRSKATGGLDAFGRRECRLNAMRKALEQASAGGPRIKYAVIWTELDKMWLKLMANERDKSFAKKRRSAKKVSDKPLKTFDADLDELESWICVL